MNMRESHANIREDNRPIDGYAYWSGKPVTPGEHELLLVPQTIMDGWQGWCSCGEWRGFGSFWEYDDRDTLLNDMRAAHERHTKAAREGK